MGPELENRAPAKTQGHDDVTIVPPREQVIVVTVTFAL